MSESIRLENPTPCPFCGSTWILIGYKYAAICNDCGATGPDSTKQSGALKQAVNLWNVRFSTPATTPAAEPAAESVQHPHGRLLTADEFSKPYPVAILEQRSQGLKHAIYLCDSLMWNPNYKIGCERVKVSLEAALERTQNGENMEDVAVTQSAATPAAESVNEAQHTTATIRTGFGGNEK